MSCSEEETTAASVLSQMSKIQQSPSESSEPQNNAMSVAHQCDIETSTSPSSNQEMASMSVGDVTFAASGVLHQNMDAVNTGSTLAFSDEEQQAKIETTLEVSSVKVFPCEYCGKAFNKSYNLKTHRRVHTGERPFPCAICGHGFANLGDLKRHARTHTGEKPFKCEFCDKAFSDFGSHKRHLRLHTGVKPFQCELCSREFTRLDSFKNHARLHTGERPYKCDECQKEFNYLTTYKRHLNIHSGERPYSCDLCGKTFTRLNYLKNHRRNHSKSSVNSTNADDVRTDDKQQDSSTPGEDNRDTTAVEMNIVADTNEEKIEDNMIQQVAEALSQEGLQVTVATVVGSNGATQPVLIETVDAASQEAASHALILAQDLSVTDNEQLSRIVADASPVCSPPCEDDESFQEGSGAKHLLITQPLLKSVHDVTAECRPVSPNLDAVVNVTEKDSGLLQNDRDRQAENESKSNEVNSEDPSFTVTANTCSGDTVYVAVDPTQANGEEILGELHVAVNPETACEDLKSS